MHSWILVLTLLIYTPSNGTVVAETKVPNIRSEKDCEEVGKRVYNTMTLLSNGATYQVIYAKCIKSGKLI